MNWFTQLFAGNSSKGELLKIGTDESVSRQGDPRFTGATACQHLQMMAPMLVIQDGVFYALLGTDADGRPNPVVDEMKFLALFCMLRDVVNRVDRPHGHSAGLQQAMEPYVKGMQAIIFGVQKASGKHSLDATRLRDRLADYLPFSIAATDPNKALANRFAQFIMHDGTHKGLDDLDQKELAIWGDIANGVQKIVREFQYKFLGNQRLSL